MDGGRDRGDAFQDVINADQSYRPFRVLGGNITSRRYVKKLETPNRVHPLPMFFFYFFIEE